MTSHLCKILGLVLRFPRSSLSLLEMVKSAIPFHKFVNVTRQSRYLAICKVKSKIFMLTSFGAEYPATLSVVSKVLSTEVGGGRFAVPRCSGAGW